MKLSALYDTAYEPYIRLYMKGREHDVDTLLTRIADKMRENFNFFVTLDTSLGGDVFDIRKGTPEQNRKFGSMIGGILKRGTVLWFRGYRDNLKFSIIDADNWQQTWNMIVPSLPDTHIYDYEPTEKEVRIRLKDKRTNEVFQTGMPNKSYKKPGKRGFSTTFDVAKHDNAVNEYEKALRQNMTWNAIGIKVKSAMFIAERHRIAIREDEKIMRPRKVRFAE